MGAAWNDGPRIAIADRVEKHQDGCHRGQVATRPGQLDTAHCERCRWLWRRIGGAAHNRSCPVPDLICATCGIRGHIPAMCDDTPVRNYP